MSNIEKTIQRLKACILDSGYSYAELEKKTGISRSSLQRYANGVTAKIPIDAIQTIAKAVGVKAEYILGWEDNNSSQGIVPLSTDNVYMRPIYESAAAGFNVLAQNTIIGYMPTYIKALSEQDNYIWINVVGDSMSPLIDDGSKVLIKKQESVDSGQIAVVLIDGEEAVVKKVVYGKDWIELQSVNPYYPPRRFEGNEVLRVKVVGLVKEVSKSLS